jgi:hypothetical protein
MVNRILHPDAGALPKVHQIMHSRLRSNIDQQSVALVTALLFLAPKIAYCAPAEAAPAQSSGVTSDKLPEAAPATAAPTGSAAPAAVDPAPNAVSTSSFAPAAADATPNPVAPQVPVVAGQVATQPAGETSAATSRAPSDDRASAGAACREEPMRDGFYLRLMFGSGYARFHGTGPNGSASSSALGSHSTLAIGGGIVRGLALAATMQFTSTDADFKGGPFVSSTVTRSGNSAPVTASQKATAAQSLLGALVDWYPDPLSGLHVGLAAGLGGIAVQNHADDSTLSGVAASGALLTGYDFALSRSWALGLALVASGATSSKLKNSDSKDTGYKLSAFSIELASSLLYF